MLSKIPSIYLFWAMLLAVLIGYAFRTFEPTPPHALGFYICRDAIVLFQFALGLIVMWRGWTDLRSALGER